MGERLVDMPTRAALHGASARVGMFASRFPSSRLSKNASFPTVGKRLVLHYTSARSVLYLRALRVDRPEAGVLLMLGVGLSPSDTSDCSAL